jgi:hypothetical protein
MVRQGMTSNSKALLAFHAEKQQGFEQVRSHLIVIPANAGIQLNMPPKDTTFFVLSAAHDIFALVSGVRRNDERFGLAFGNAT